MAGLSASTSNVGFLTPWAACITGALAGLLYVGISRLLVRDVHGGDGGRVGALCDACDWRRGAGACGAKTTPFGVD